MLSINLKARIKTTKHDGFDLICIATCRRQNTIKCSILLMLLSSIIFFQSFFFSDFIKFLLPYDIQNFLIRFIYIFMLFLRFSIGDQNKIILIYFNERMVTSKILNERVKRIIIFETFYKIFY
jgi:hypothetical protein